MSAQIAAGDSSPAILVQHLTKSFVDPLQGRITVLRDISFEAQPGEIIGIFGPSGCGKTTLLRIICGILPYEGDVFLFGRPASAQRGVVAYVPQRAELLDWKTLRKNALLGYQIANVHPKTADAPVAQRAEALIKRFRLEDVIHKYPRQCSGGERQRVALIRALLTPANIVALDEPAGAIDHISRSRIYETLLDIMEEGKTRGKNITVIIISHDPEELLFLCDRILVMPAIGRTLGPCMTVPFTRPRQSLIKFASEFVELKRTLWNSIL
jgi:NitT/TauT family transport system ATP-binding protein